MLFPTHVIAERCQKFVVGQAPELKNRVRIVDLIPLSEKARSEEFAIISPKISAVIFPGDNFKIAKQFWQHSGDGVSSRRAEYCHSLFDEGVLVLADSSAPNNASPRFRKGPRRYQTKTSIDLDSPADKPQSDSDPHDPTQFVEERFGRNLDISMTRNAKLAVRRRIAGSLTEDIGLAEAVYTENKVNATGTVVDRSEDDIYLYPCGMSSIFNTHRNLMATKGPLKSIVYGYERTNLTPCRGIRLLLLASLTSTH
jgi:cystathionine gamma-synthase